MVPPQHENAMMYSGGGNLMQRYSEIVVNRDVQSWVLLAFVSRFRFQASLHEVYFDTPLGRQSVHAFAGCGLFDYISPLLTVVVILSHGELNVSHRSVLSVP